MQNLNEQGQKQNLSHLPIQNEILFVMDSVGFHEFTTAKTPNCNKLGKAVRSYSASFYTPPYIHAMFRGCLPQPSGRPYWPYGRYSNAGENTIIPMSLKKRGYKTYMLSSNIVLTNKSIETELDVISYHPYFEFEYNAGLDQLTSHKLIEWFLNNLEEPFFAFFLVTETHTPYMGRRGDRTNKGQIEAIEYVDRSIGKLMNEIIKKKLKHKTRLIVTSDHAECWDKGATVNHGHNPTHLWKFVMMDKMKRLTEVFLVKGII